jgi:hypothetical protein
MLHRWRSSLTDPAIPPGAVSLYTNGHNDQFIRLTCSEPGRTVVAAWGRAGPLPGPSKMTAR